MERHLLKLTRKRKVQNKSKTNTGNHSCTGLTLDSHCGLRTVDSKSIQMENKHKKQKLLMKRLVPRNGDSSGKSRKEGNRAIKGVKKNERTRDQKEDGYQRPE